MPFAVFGSDRISCATIQTFAIGVQNWIQSFERFGIAVQMYVSRRRSVFVRCTSNDRSLKEDQQGSISLTCD